MTSTLGNWELVMRLVPYVFTDKWIRIEHDSMRDKIDTCEVESRPRGLLKSIRQELSTFCFVLLIIRNILVNKDLKPESEHSCYVNIEGV